MPMRKHLSLLLVVVCTAVCLAPGCRSTIGSFVHLRPDYAGLPTQTLEATAAEIEAAVEDGNRAAELADREDCVLSANVRQAIRTRAARIELVDRLRDAGFAYERRNGRLSLLRSSAYKKATTRQDRDRNAMLIMGENDDRWVIYEGILDANGYPPKSLSAIQAIFFETRKDLLDPGQLYENEAGDPITK
ncbi:MAG: hypothetical protein ACLFTT_01220 [Candidatus Hydrogenedentota bacterium]